MHHQGCAEDLGNECTEDERGRTVARAALGRRDARAGRSADRNGAYAGSFCDRNGPRVWRLGEGESFSPLFFFLGSIFFFFSPFSFHLARLDKVSTLPRYLPRWDMYFYKEGEWALNVSCT